MFALTGSEVTTTPTLQLLEIPCSFFYMQYLVGIMLYFSRLASFIGMKVEISNCECVCVCV